jgi:hypothetical protein
VDINSLAEIPTVIFPESFHKARRHRNEQPPPAKPSLSLRFKPTRRIIAEISLQECFLKPAV